MRLILLMIYVPFIPARYAVLKDSPLNTRGGYYATNTKARRAMPKCGVCGGLISRTLIPHGAICEDDTKANKLNDLRQENNNE
jgi:hypothetical protein